MVNDTLINIVRDTVYIAQRSELVEAYKEIIDSQTATYNSIIMVFLGLVALFAGATWWYNKSRAKSEIKDEVYKVFETEKNTFLEGQKLEFKTELHFQKAESARLFALFNLSTVENAKDELEKTTGLVNLVYWWHEVFVNNYFAGNSFGCRLGVDHLIKSLQRIIDDKLEVNFLPAYQNQYSYKFIYNSLEFIHDSLKVERETLFLLLNKIAQKNNLDFSLSKEQETQDDKEQEAKDEPEQGKEDEPR